MDVLYTLVINMTNYYQEAIAELADALKGAIDNLRESAECGYSHTDDAGREWTNCDIYESVLNKHVTIYRAEDLYCENCGDPYSIYWNDKDTPCPNSEDGSHYFRTSDPNDPLSARILINGVEPG